MFYSLIIINNNNKKEITPEIDAGIGYMCNRR